jgi:hypothetical protein
MPGQLVRSKGFMPIMWFAGDGGPINNRGPMVNDKEIGIIVGDCMRNGALYFYVVFSTGMGWAQDNWVNTL